MPLCNKYETSVVANCAIIVMQFAITAAGLSRGLLSMFTSSLSERQLFEMIFVNLEFFGKLRLTFFVRIDMFLPNMQVASKNVIIINSHRGQKCKNNTQVDKYQDFPLSKSVKQNQIPQKRLISC